MFAAILNFDACSVEFPPAVQTEPFRPAVILGASRQAAFLCTDPPEGLPTDEAYGIEKLDDRYCIVGRIRLDRRAELAAALETPSATKGAPKSDARLCLEAFAKWGEHALQRLAGDFSFILWDEAGQRLWGVRDQIGVRPLFHAANRCCCVLSDSLDWIGRNASFGANLDDFWLADFLTLGFSREFHRTVYRDIRRLPPAHLLTCSGGDVRIRRYWRLDVPEPLYLPSRGAYGERFRDVVSRAIADRLPPGGVGISVSGGVDSNTLTACTIPLHGSGRVTTYFEAHAELPDFDEEQFARLAARHLGVPLHVQPFDHAGYDLNWLSRGTRLPEPMRLITSIHNLRPVYRALAQQATVWFEGEGPDNALQLDRRAYLAWLYRAGDWRRLTRALVDYAWVKGLSGWGETLRRWSRPDRPGPLSTDLPSWLNPDFVARLHLAERARDLGEGGDSTHPWHPDAIRSLTSPIWECFFADYNVVYEALAPISWRHPYLDLDVLQFMLSAPPIPWGWKKQLVRKAMAGRLPRALLKRPKSSLPTNPIVEKARRHGLPALPARDRLADYLDPDGLPDLNGSSPDMWHTVDAYVLGHWIASTP